MLEDRNLENEHPHKFVLAPLMWHLLLHLGYDPIYGARPLRRSITKFLEDKLAEACLSNIIHQGTEINVTQKIKPNVYGNRPIYSPIFEDIYTSDISVEFDYTNVDFSKIQKNEKQEGIIKKEETKIAEKS